MAVEIKVPISPGELVDKITILEIKSARMTRSGEARQRAHRAHDAAGHVARVRLRVARHRCAVGLRTINEKLWDIEDLIRDKERRARSTRSSSSSRAPSTSRTTSAPVRDINTRLGSKIVEEATPSTDGHWRCSSVIAA